MDRKTIKELYANIDACSYVTKGESDSREVHSNFKVVCGLNLAILTKEFESYALVAAAKYDELVNPEYAVYCDLMEKLEESKNKEKRQSSLTSRYAEAILSHETFSEWLNDVFYMEEIEVPALKMWPFANVPEKIAGGYMIAIKTMIADFPEFD